MSRQDCVCWDYETPDAECVCDGVRTWDEYDRAASDCAKLPSWDGKTLPANMSAAAVRLIDIDPDSFRVRVRSFAYAQAMEGTPEE